jgi:hypothetical protein
VGTIRRYSDSDSDDGNGSITLHIFHLDISMDRN